MTVQTMNTMSVQTNAAKNGAAVSQVPVQSAPVSAGSATAELDAGRYVASMRAVFGEILRIGQECADAMAPLKAGITSPESRPVQFENKALTPEGKAVSGKGVKALYNLALAGITQGAENPALVQAWNAIQLARQAEGKPCRLFESLEESLLEAVNNYLAYDGLIKRLELPKTLQNFRDWFFDAKPVVAEKAVARPAKESAC